MAEMRVELVAIEREIWSGVAKSVIARTVEGDIGVLPGHAPLLAQLKEGFSARIILQDGSELGVAVHGGFLSVTKEKVSILAEDAQLADEIDVNQARAAFNAAEEDSDESLRARAQLLAAGQSL
ncbi:F0F1 ATP synthase subunit epsilon [Nakamurella silvestris]|nr:F0F1 ATP synthase subunit epsilon [Nakamurella silvestris]